MPRGDATSRAAFQWARALVGTVAALGGLASLGGCAVGPDFVRPATTVADQWQVARDPRVAADVAAEAAWWKAFNDPVLDRLVELSYRQSLPLQVAGLRIVEARAQLGVATGEQFPQVQEVTGSAVAVGISDRVANLASIKRNFLEYQLGFDALWELDFWGKYRRGVESAADNLLASVADYHSALVSLSAEVARTYVVIRTYEVLIALAGENVKVQEEGLQMAQSRFRNGATSELDVTQATTLVESTRASIPALEAGFQQARNALSILLGKRPGTVDALLEGPGGIPSPPVKVAVGVPAEMLRRRPDIRSAELYAAAQCARIGVAKAELYPSFSLFGTFGLRANTAGSPPHNLFSAQSLYYAVGPQIVWPFFNYGRLTNGVRVEDARFQQLLVQYQDTVLKAAQEVEDALVGFVSSGKAMAFQQGSVQAAQRSVQIALLQYREGAVDFQRVLDAERSLLQEQNNLAQTTSSVATNLVALYKALGGGWEVAQGQPVVPEQTQAEMKKRTSWGDLLSQPRGPEKAPAGKR